jgi:hypothetical protein
MPNQQNRQNKLELLFCLTDNVLFSIKDDNKKIEVIREIKKILSKHKPIIEVTLDQIGESALKCSFKK